MTKAENEDRLEEIVVGVSKLPVDQQECILAAIKGMLFTRNLLLKQEENGGAVR